MGRADAFAQVLAITGQILEVHPDNVVARAVRLFVESTASALEGNAGSIPAAARQLEALVAEAPDELQVRLLLVDSYKNMQQPERSLPVLQDALQRDPFNPRILFELGSL